MDVGIHAKDSRSNRVDMERPMSMSNVDAVTPQVRFTDECPSKADSGLSADGVGGGIVRVDVVVK